MAGEAITDEIAVGALNNVVIPAARQMRRAMLLMRRFRADWRSAAKNLDARFPADGGLVLHGRTAEGVPEVSSAHVRAFEALCSRLDAMAVDDGGVAGGPTSEDLLNALAGWSD